MTRNREFQLVLGNAAAVVDHADHAEPAAGRCDLDARSTGIERVLDQFLHHARRPLDYLAGGDLVDHRFCELAYGHDGILHGFARRRPASHWEVSQSRTVLALWLSSRFFGQATWKANPVRMTWSVIWTSRPLATRRSVR